MPSTSVQLSPNLQMISIIRGIVERLDYHCGDNLVCPCCCTGCSCARIFSHITAVWQCVGPRWHRVRVPGFWSYCRGWGRNWWPSSFLYGNPRSQSCAERRRRRNRSLSRVSESKSNPGETLVLILLSPNSACVVAFSCAIYCVCHWKLCETVRRGSTFTFSVYASSQLLASKLLMDYWHHVSLTSRML